MNRKIALALAAVAICASAQIPYKVIVPTGDTPSGSMVYMINFDTKEVIDSVAVADEKAVFKGDVDEPFLVTISDRDKNYGITIVEQGTSTINQAAKVGVGTMLNDRLKEAFDKVGDVVAQAQNMTSEVELDSLFNVYLALERQIVTDNIDNPVGYYFLLDYAQEAPSEEVLAILDANPDMLGYEKVKSMKDAFEKKAETAVGKKFVDFEVIDDGVTKRLSDYVGKGQYVLVDFWASWCGPCMREIETLREIYNTYPQDKLKVLGIAVWDKPEDTKAAIQRKSIPWECILDAQTIPTDAYGIKGIPSIILFGPDGTILSRDLQGAALKKAVANALN